MERTAVWKWRELKRGEEEINEIIGRAGGQSSEVGPYTGVDRPYTQTHTPLLQYVQCTQSQLSASRNQSVGCCMCAAVGHGGCWVVVGRCRGYGDKLRCPVTSIWGGLGLVCRALLVVICCRISDGLEMGLEREFMPPIKEKREGYPERTARTKQPAWTFDACRAAALLQITGKSKYQLSAAFTSMKHLSVSHNSAVQTLGFTATRSVAALHGANAARGAVMGANVEALTATQGGLNKNRVAPTTTMEVNGHMTWVVNTDSS